LFAKRYPTVGYRGSAVNTHATLATFTRKHIARLQRQSNMSFKDLGTKKSNTRLYTSVTYRFEAEKMSDTLSEQIKKLRTIL